MLKSDSVMPQGLFFAPANDFVVSYNCRIVSPISVKNGFESLTGITLGM
jgi:hypothetical protein